jgi:hypothetical protein
MPAWMWVVAVLWTIVPLVAIEGAHHRSDGLKVPRLLHADADVMQAVARGPATRGGSIRETLDNPANPRDNGSVIAGHGWFHGRQAARIR